MLHSLAEGGATFWLPEQRSTAAPAVDSLFYFIYWVCVVFFIIVAGAMFYFMIRYRRRSVHDKVNKITHNTPLELAWTILPSLLLIFMFWWGFKGFLDMRTAPTGAYEVKVDAQKWSWSFKYPHGIDDQDLHVPVNTPIRLVMTSADVIHSLFIPAFRVKRDVVPGRYSELWFQATEPGQYRLTCTEYCGTKHSDMNGYVVVHPLVGDNSFDHWLETADPLSNLTPEQYSAYSTDAEKFIKDHKDDPTLAKIMPKLVTPELMGQRLYARKGCSQCHSVTGVDNPATGGPAWNNIFGTQVVFQDGESTTIDENYIRESVLNPPKHVVKGFNNIMPKIAVKDREIDMIISYIKSLSGTAGAKKAAAPAGGGGK
jgi:cytochrome c oxidase subunit 2